MPLFKINNKVVKKLNSTSPDSERALQKLLEANLEEVLNIILVHSEYSTSSGGRIDTLGIDKNGSPCIIEYKKNQNDNVINQGLSYLRWLLDHTAEFEKLCHKKKIDREIDWESARVICIAESYTKFDADTVDFLPINIELLRYRIYDQSFLYIEPENYQKVRIAKAGLLKKSKQGREKSEPLQKVYSVEDHLKSMSEKTMSLFQNLREKLLSLDETITEEAKAKYIAYKLATNFCDVVANQNSLKIFLNVKSGQLKDPKNIARDLTKPKPVGHWGNGDYEVKLEKQSEIDTVFHLIKQSYDLNN